MRINSHFFILIAFTLAGISCKKLVSIPEPVSSQTTTGVFATEQQANSALAGIYTLLINGNNPASNSIYSSFSDGYTTLLGGLSSDELMYNQVTGDYLFYNSNRLLATSSPSTTIWTTAYTAIYGANAVIEGVAASTSAALHDSARKELTGEAKFVRAFSYFYLVNLFGDVPLALTIDFNQTANMTRTPQASVYQQIISDLKDAQSVLPTDYSVAAGERIRPNKWAATALLARALLFTGDYAGAAAQAASVIGYTTQYNLVGDPDGVFLKNSTEAIWQLQQSTSVANIGNATAEGAELLPNPLSTGFVSYYLSSQLMAAFETGDQRRVKWVGSSDNSFSGTPSGPYYFAYKYKTGRANYSIGGAATEYYMVLRLAEQYLIKAEAETNGATGGDAAAIADLNVLRHRAGLPDLFSSLPHDQVIAAVAHERQTELFAEWGHRWLDLKRTGQAHNVLSVIPIKQPWQGDYQLLYPIPVTEITTDHNLVQNPGYH